MKLAAAAAMVLITDGDRVWFGNDRGIYLNTAAAGLQKVLAFHDATDPAAIFPAGFCR